MQLEEELDAIIYRLQLLENDVGTMKKQIDKLFKTKETKRNSKTK